MASQDIINYLKEGKKRGFSLQILKQKLLEGGFEDKEINLAISELSRIESAFKPAQPQFSSQPHPQPQQSKPITPPTSQTMQQKPMPSQATQSYSPAPQFNQPAQQKPQSPPQQQTSSPQPHSSSNPYFNQKPALNGESISIWLKISGVLGIASLVFSLIFLIAVISFNNPTIYLIYMSIIIIFLAVYIFGFHKIGKRLDSKLLKLSSLFMIILLILALIILFMSTFSENKILRSISTFANNTNTGFAAFLVISTFSILILFIISKILFSVSLVKLRNRLKLAGVTGIVGLITCLFAITSLILFLVLIFAFSEVFLNIDAISLSSFGDTLIKVAATGLLFIISLTTMATLKFISLILEVIMLFKNSKGL